MDVRLFLDAAIAAADPQGRFAPESVSRHLKMTKIQQRATGAELQEMQMVRTGTRGWQLIGVAGELSKALHGRADRRGDLGPSRR